MVAFRPEWEGEFRQIQAEILKVAERWVLAVDHIGSTSVSGLPAKDVIDVQVTVADLDVPLREPLESLGFKLGVPTQDHCPSGMELNPQDLAKRFYKKLARPVNLHVRKLGTFNQCYPLLFRDYLRANAQARSAYAAVKLELARRFPNDMDAYYDIKDPVCDAIMAGAYLWAEISGWRTSQVSEGAIRSN